MTLGPSFDPLMATAMSSELTRAKQGDAAAARAHRSEDLEAARDRAASSRSGSRLRTLLNRLLRRSGR